MTNLVKYDALKAALAACITIDEVKDIRDKAEAMRAYARMANDVQLELDAAEHRLRSERRLGEIVAEQKRTVGLNRGTLSRGTEMEPRDTRPTLSDAGIDKKLSSRAQKLAAMPEALFNAGIQRVRDGISAHKRSSLDITAVDKKERRAAREAELAAKIVSLPQARFGVIVADPEWRFEPYSRDTGMDRAADNHYPTSATDAICHRDVASIAADDCVLFLWATVPMLPDALAVMAAWGFAYKSHAIWAKDRIGTGYWFRNRHEILLVGTRGSIPAPAMGTQSESVIDAPVGAHSTKPEIFLEMIEAYFPNLPKIELNRRGPPRDGWAAWGFEAEQPESEVMPDAPGPCSDSSPDVTAPRLSEAHAASGGALVGEPAALGAFHPHGEGEPAREPGLVAGSPIDDDLDIPNFLPRAPGGGAPCMHGSSPAPVPPCDAVTAAAGEFGDPPAAAFSQSETGEDAKE